MLPLDKIKEYSTMVGEQIRWKKAEAMITDEIENHIYDQRDAYILNGDTEEIATDKAILEMGGGVLVGLELDRIHRPSPQWAMIGLTGILMLIGFISNYFISITSGLSNGVSSIPYILAFLIFILCYHMDFTILGKYAIQIYCIAIIGLPMILILVSRLGGDMVGIWLYEEYFLVRKCIAFVFPLLFALVIYRVREKGYVGILLSGIRFCILAFVLVFSSGVSGLISFTLSSLSILCIAIGKGWFHINKKIGLLWVLVPTFLIFIGGIFLALQYSNYNTPIELLSNLVGRPQNDGYQTSRMMDILSDAVFLGRGNLSEYGVWWVNNWDFNEENALVFLIHYLGLIVFWAILILLVIFCMISIYKIVRQKSILGTLVALSIFLTFFFQCIFYITETLGYGMVASVSLPFISYGTLGLFINAALIGFMLSVFRTGYVVKDSIDNNSIENKLISCSDGKIIIDVKKIWRWKK